MPEESFRQLGCFGVKCTVLETPCHRPPRATTVDISDILSQLGGLQSVPKEPGISETQATSAATALIPAIPGGFKKQAQARRGGLGGLGGLPIQLGGGGLLDSVRAPTPTGPSAGNSVLG